MAYPLMQKATAVWLVENTTLTFQQIAEFCGLHELEVNGIADGEVAQGIKGFDPQHPNAVRKGENWNSYDWARLMGNAKDFSSATARR